MDLRFLMLKPYLLSHFLSQSLSLSLYFLIHERLCGWLCETLLWENTRIFSCSYEDCTGHGVSGVAGPGLTPSSRERTFTVPF